MSEIVLNDVTKSFPGDVTAVDDVTLTVDDGEFMVLVGPSGCGKTTLLRLIAGLEKVSSGCIRIGEREVTDLAAPERDIAMVFQNYALYPHMTVRANLGFALKIQKTSKAVIERRVGNVARLLGLDHLLDRRPAALSGGQRQRVAMGRAIVREPQAFLMDEPLSNLDAKLRVTMRAELASLHSRLGTTTVYVTHDQVEAMTLGNRVAVMHDGVVQQVDTPQVLYRQPRNLFVAAFIGSPSMNLVQATIAGDEIAFAGYRIPLDPARRPASTREGQVILGMRPESFEDAAFAAPGLPQIEVVVEVLEDLGSDAHVIFPLDAPRVETAEVKAAIEEPDETMQADRRSSLFTARLDPRTNAKAGDKLCLAIAPSTFHFFDPETGESLDR